MKGQNGRNGGEKVEGSMDGRRDGRKGGWNGRQVLYGRTKDGWMEGGLEGWMGRAGAKNCMRELKGQRWRRLAADAGLAQAKAGYGLAGE